MRPTKWLMIGGLVIGLNAPSWTEESDLDKAEYLSSCANCHGEDGKGKGPFSETLKTPPPDLTTLAKKNNGVFPVISIYRNIDRRKSG
jgi:mono/diheme cytochrome c family protein